MNKRARVTTVVLTLGLVTCLALASAMAQDMTKDSSMKKDSKNDSMQAGSALSSSDRKFVMEAAHGGMMEVALGRMAVDKASSPDVKQFAQRLVDDHSKANDELRELASQKGIVIPTGEHAMMSDMKMSHPTTTDGSSSSAGGSSSTSSASSGTMSSASSTDSHSAHKSMMKQHDKLSKLSGADFDREYMSLMVKDHTKDVKEFEDASTKAKDADLKAWASKTLPTLREHLQMARDINGKVADSKKMSSPK